MTLSNIFFGKKVVQQAYLNNALIYQSKGWETLPSTCTEVWTKEYGIQSNLYSLTIDLDNNIYALGNKSLYKFDSNGEILWQKDFSKEPENNISYLQLNSTNNSVFVMRSTGSDKSPYHFYIDEFSSDGSIKNEYDIRAIIGGSFNSVNGYIVDDGYIYINVYYYSTYDYSYSNRYLVKIDMLEKKQVQIAQNIYINSGCLVSYGKYLYAAVDYGPVNPNSGKYLVKFNKEDLNKAATINNWIDTSDSYNQIDSITTDKLGNIIYKTFRNGTFKYNVDSTSKVKLPIDEYNDNAIIHVDYQQNIYVIEYVNQPSTLSSNLLKISSDNTLIYKIPIKDNVNAAFTVDYQGNIYYSWNLSGQTYIKKLINIEKKGN